MIELVRGFDRLDDVRAMFSEYTQMLVDTDETFARYLELQHYDAELVHPEEKYGEPDGRLWLALSGGQAAGTVALRRLDETRCEMKRLYVRPAFRRLGLGRTLMEQVIRDAKEIGYRHMLLDTLPPLTEALAMYRARGFYDIPCYNDTPVDSTIFLQLDL